LSGEGVLKRFSQVTRPNTAGDIFIDGHSIKKLDLKSLRSNIASVSQEPSLFSGNIKDNLRIGKMDASDEEIIEAATTANVHSFISKLPNEYLTEVGERGVQLSGGQKQRIAIARAILKDPPILLLDEATSALDSESEKLVQDALERAMRGRTVILIAHRMSTIVNADTIVVVENGRVAQTGTHHELLEKSTFYSNVCSMQNIEKEAEKKVASTSDNVVEEQIGEAHIRQSSTKQGTKNKLERVESKQRKREIVKEIHPFFRLWYGLHKEDILKILFGSSAAAVSGISKPLFGYFIMTIGVAYYDPDAKRKVSKYSLIFFTAGMVTLVSNILQHYIYGIVGEKAMKNLREALFSAVLRNELGWFEKPKNGVGFLTSRIVSDTSTVKTIISDRMAVIVQCISSILIATIVSMYVNWRMGLVSWAVMPCHFIGGLIQAKSAKGFYGDSAIAHRELVSLASEAASNIRTVASFVYEDEIIKKAELSLQEPLKKTKIESMKYGVIQGISLCLWNIAHAVALWYTTVLVRRKQASFENSIRSYQIFSLTVPSITELWTLIPMVMSAIAILNPAFDTLDRETEIVPDKPENPSKGWLVGRTEFQDVHFNYPSRPEATILDGFNLIIEPGQKVALVGPSGAGKSSVLALILRFYDPYRGRVLIDNKNIRDYNLRWLRKQIGLVQQEPILFNISIRDNISYGSESTSETEIIQAAMEANIHEFISGLPEGYDTIVGEKGSQLSGGQKQRIAIARTLLKRPPILLLDEATSALDGESERVVMSSLGAKEWTNKDARASKVTSITVAHRLSTVINAEMIVVMEKGKVVELGDHETLISADDGIYSRLFHLQSNMKD
ncbi:ABC transporter B family member 14-like, partial [Panicum hallii]|uniref:ABC transporter B family member 14-like n=1 Tax=Panicum hallii TaxID=206008 RepID=UPI000DF4CC93